MNKTPEMDSDRLSQFYLQLDTLTPDEKSQVIDYLKQSLSTEASGKDAPKTVKTITNISSDLLNTIQSIEKLTSRDLNVYIHGNPSWHQIFWEAQDRTKDPLLAGSHFNHYYNKTLKAVDIIAKDLWNKSTEYTIRIPSLEQEGRAWGYVWVTFVLNNWYKIKDTWKFASENMEKKYGLDTEVGDFMNSFMDYLITHCNVVKKREYTHLVERTTTHEHTIRAAIWKLKSAFISSINDIEENKGLIVKE